MTTGDPMLNAFIIDALRREREQRNRQPALELPKGPPPGWEPEPERGPEAPAGGVVVIDF